MSDSLPLCHGHLTPWTDNPNQISGEASSATLRFQQDDRELFRYFFFFSFAHSGFYDVASIPVGTWRRLAADLTKKTLTEKAGTETRGNTASPLANNFLRDARRRLVLHCQIRHLPQV